MSALKKRKLSTKDNKDLAKTYPLSKGDSTGKNKKVRDNVIQIPRNFRPRPYQLELYKALDGICGQPETRLKRAIIVWHRRAGKDIACFCYMVKEAAQYPGNYFYIFPTNKMAKKAIWENVNPHTGFKMLDHIPDEIITKKSNQDLIITIKSANGMESTISLIGYDTNPDSCRGVSAKGVVYSEFAFTDPASYRNMMPSVREADGWVIINSTPNGPNHFYDLFRRNENNSRWFVSTVQTYWPDRKGYVPNLSPEEIEQIKHEEMLPDDEVEREYGCSFSTAMEGAIYASHIQTAYEQKRIGEYVYDSQYPVNTYWDLGISDDTVIWFKQTIGNKNIFIDYYEENNSDLNHFIDILNRLGYHYGTHWLPHDGRNRNVQTGVSTSDILAELITNHDLTGRVDTVDKTPRAVGINKVRSRFSTFHFDQGKCQEGLKKLELYHRRFDKKRRVYMEEPVHDWTSHAADALKTEALASYREHKVGFNPDTVKVRHDYDIFAY